MNNSKANVFVEIPCTVCNEPQLLSAESIFEGKRLAAEGCRGAASYECPVQQFVPFTPTHLESLEAVLASLANKRDPSAGPGHN